MIIPLTEMPMTQKDKQKCYREMIRNDIQEAIDRHIEMFEFDGDYNWKYLAGYAKEEADIIWRRTFRRIVDDAREKHGLGWIFGPDHGVKGEYIKIRSAKKADRIHVYCQIDFDAPDRICGQVIEEAMKKKEEQDRKLEEKDLSMKIMDIDSVPRRTRVALLRAGIGTVGDLAGKKFSDLARIRNMGKKGLEETAALMERFGMEVQNDVQNMHLQ